MSVPALCFLFSSFFFFEFFLFNPKKKKKDYEWAVNVRLQKKKLDCDAVLPFKEKQIDHIWRPIIKYKPCTDVPRLKLLWPGHKLY